MPEGHRRDLHRSGVTVKSQDRSDALEARGEQPDSRALWREQD
jgi:hypothetical protein